MAVPPSIRNGFPVREIAKSVPEKLQVRWELLTNDETLPNDRHARSLALWRSRSHREIPLSQNATGFSWVLGGFGFSAKLGEGGFPFAKTSEDIRTAFLLFCTPVFPSLDEWHGLTERIERGQCTDVAQDVPHILG